MPIGIGYIDTELLHTLHSTVVDIPIKHGDTTWGTHKWVMHVADALQKVEGFLVKRHISIQWIKDKFEEKGVRVRVWREERSWRRYGSNSCAY